MKTFSKLVSVVFHPIFLSAYCMAYILFASSNEVFTVPEGKNMQWFISSMYSTLLMPLLVIFLLWRLKFIASLQMETSKERYGPLIACMSFYFWIFWVFHKDLQAPSWIQMFLLGSFLTIVISFFLTIFSKISLHISSMSGAFTFALLLNVATRFQDVIFLLVVAISLMLVWFSRHTLKAHNVPQLVTGAVIGFIGSLIAFLIY